uniref:RING-H2 finger protein ATL56-like n=1 Tax=Nicotiana tabacum TaxID=4097 RepID=A0A1S4CCI5_TOBAC|nr:PREDICTED: RING-H2 finger protein ATL56-like [Nicotiana tabacum]
MKNHELGFASRVTRVIIMGLVISVILLLVFVGVLVLIHVCVVLRAFRRRIDNVNMMERGVSMSQEDIDKLPCFNFQAKEKGVYSPVDCAICLDSLKLGDKCRILPQCNHYFHAECIDLWLLKSSFCPICRASADMLKGCSISAGESSGYSESGQTREHNVHMTETRTELRESQEVDNFN